MKNQKLNEARLLAVCQRVLPTRITDPHLANTIYEDILKEVRLFNSLDSFGKFCAKGSLPDCEEATISEFKTQLEGNFGAGNVAVTPQADGTAVAVEVALPDYIVNSLVKVVAPDAEEEAAEAPFVPFPVALPADPGLIWMLARRENLGQGEAARALANIQEEFWASKKGQILQREGVARCFAEFIVNVPAASLAESSIKRYHKDPETLTSLRLIPSSEVTQ